MEILEGSMPYEKWYGRKLSVAHLRIFGILIFNRLQIIDYSKGNEIY